MTLDSVHAAVERAPVRMARIHLCQCQIRPAVARPGLDRWEQRQANGAVIELTAGGLADDRGLPLWRRRQDPQCHGRVIGIQVAQVAFEALCKPLDIGGCQCPGNPLESAEQVRCHRQVGAPHPLKEHCPPAPGPLADPFDNRGQFQVRVDLHRHASQLVGLFEEPQEGSQVIAAHCLFRYPFQVEPSLP